MNIHPTDRLGDLVTRFPSLTVPLEDWGLDFCCGGDKPLNKAAEEKGLHVDTMVALLNKTVARGTPTPSTQEYLGENPAEYETPKLISHIKYTHHAYLRKTLPELQTLAAKVTAAHSLSAPQLFEVETVVRTLAKELGDHLETEETVLFPQLEHPLPRDNLGTVIALLEEEHQGAGQALEQLRSLTQNYALPSWACNTYRRFMALLKEFETDMHRHVHLENSVLFPRFSKVS